MRQKWKRGLAGLLAAAALLGLPAGCKRQKEKTQTPADSDAVTAHDTEQVRQELQRLGGEAAYQNAFSELKEQSTTTFEGETYYRYSQYYHGIPVYGRSVVYVADENGERLTVTGNAEDVNYQGALMPQLTQQQAQEAVSQYVLGQYGEESLQELVVPEMTGQELCIYPQASSGDILAHQLTVFYNGEPYEAVVADEDGEVLTWTLQIEYEDDPVPAKANGEDVDGKNVTFQACLNPENGEYIMQDTKRNIVVYDANGETLVPSFSYMLEDSENEERVIYDVTRGILTINGEKMIGDRKVNINSFRWEFSTQENINGVHICTTTSMPWQHKQAVTAISRAAYAYDFYQEILKRTGYNGKNAKLSIVVRDKGAKAVVAYSNTSSPTVYSESMLSFYKDMGIDTIGHEYTHSNAAQIADLKNTGESGAINEALADIFGEMIEDYADGEMDGSCDWENGSRSLRNPGSKHDPTTYQGKYWADTADTSKGKDNGGVHKNSTVISYAAYLMWYGIDGTEAKRISTETLAKIWYRAMLMMPSDCNFMECRTLVEQAATSAKLTDKQLRCVSEAFDMVKIPSSRVEYTISTDAKLCVYDADGKLYDNYTYQVYGCETPFLLDGTFKEHISERTQTVTSAEPQPLNLPEGYYIIRILDNTDAQQPYTVCVAVGKSERTQLEIFTNYYTEETPTELAYEMRTERIEFPLSDGQVYYYNEISYPYFKGSTAAEKTLNAHYADIIAERRNNDTDYDALYAEEKRYEATLGIPYYNNLNAKVTYNKNGVVSITSVSVMWSGGMHPYWTISGLIYEVKSGKQLTYRDILQGSDEQIEEVLRQEQLKAVGKDMKKDQNACEGYALTDEGICFYYNVGDAVDRVPIVIPYTSEDSYQIDVEALLNGTMTENSGSSAGYAAVVQEAIGLRDEVGSYASGGGFLYDLNGDGQLELILLHDMLCEMENAVGKVPMMVCSVYTMENGTAVTLLKQKQLYVEAGGPSGSVGVVWKDGKNYFYLTSESGDSSGDPVMMRRGSWYLYELNGTQLTQSVKTEYWLATKWTGSTFQTLSSQSGATINGSKVDYAAYERWVGTLTKIKETVGCVSYYTGQEDAVSLEELLKQVQ